MSHQLDDSAEKIKRRAERLQQSREQPVSSPLRGFGTFGMIGWSIATPTVAGGLLGLWLNKHFPGQLAWPVALILGGLALGIFIAWNWAVREQRDNDSPDRTNS